MEDDRFESTWVQTDVHIRFGLWGCWDSETQSYIAYGPKGLMGQMARLMNNKKVTVNLKKDKHA